MLKRTFLVAGMIVALIGVAIPAKATVLNAYDPVFPGVPRGSDPFSLTFDENGTGTLCTIAGCSADNGFIDGNGFLAYSLPEAVTLGDIAIPRNPGEPCTTTADCSDGLRFTQLPSGAFVMEYMSDHDGTQLADTGFAKDFSAAFVGAGEDSNGNFAYFSTGCITDNNCYFGKSDPDLVSGVPEPTTLTLIAAALFGIGAAIRWRRS